MNTGAAVRILLSEAARLRLAPALVQAAGSRPLHFVQPGEGEADLAFVSRDVTGLSTKHRVTPETQAFYDALRAASALQWVHVHSAGADRPVYLELHGRGVALTTSAGANADVVAQTALAGLLALARRFPQLQAAQRAHQWAPLIQTGLPRDLRGQTAVVVGWGGIGQYLGTMLQALGLHVVAVRRQSAPPHGGLETVSYDELDAVLPRADWLILACPLTGRTRQLIGARALSRLPSGAHLINVARGDVVDEPALVEALRTGRLAGAHLDVFAHEPLARDSPLWDLPNVIATPHSAGFSDANAARVDEAFVDNFQRWLAGTGLRNRI
ncbi:D-2-hydroxyacid dehydrogenase [Acidovorax sp. SRB_24]|uniref:D-2-hydroxyacid dehydrogenase n=1 Tax=Acidovorax sp. SRB_24 TaxID=1962700 RepID=UPI00145FC282|nr:D-2-hydroxyacid dehydrogenase [Acidovorax sp. SRB_24]NMM76724.1 hydroxyacid dehydrogenase [Acidovorax sp. SRB_24]